MAKKKTKKSASRGNFRDYIYVYFFKKKIAIFIIFQPVFPILVFGNFPSFLKAL